MAQSTIVGRIKEFALGVFGLFVGVGIVPVFIGALIAYLLGYKNLAEYILVFGWGGWIAVRTLVGWWMSREWRKSEELRIREGRESAGDLMRREEWEKKKRHRREYAMDAMRKRAEAKQSKDGEVS